MKKIFFISFFFAAFTCIVIAQSKNNNVGNGKLQLHFIDVGQGDTELLISPQGEVVLFDNGVNDHCEYPIEYLYDIGIKEINYHIISHYHADHIGCAEEVLSKFPLAENAVAYDRGHSYNSTFYRRYVNAIGNHRKTAIVGDSIVLDASTNTPVRIKFIASNGAGVTTSNENDLSLVAVVRFGNFDAELGGDLSGYKTGNYEDIETEVAKKVGQVEVYKVHHHGSNYSSNEYWLSIIKPKIAIISASATIGNNYGHPTEECLERLHNASIKTYWTELGGGVDPDPLMDVVAGNILIQVEPNGDDFTVKYHGDKTDNYSNWENISSPNQNQNTLEDSSFFWSKNSNIYHYKGCSQISRIKPENLREGNIPPAGKTLHHECPKL